MNPIPTDAIQVQVEALATAVDGLLTTVLTHWPDPRQTPPDVYEAVMRLERARGMAAMQAATEQLWLNGFERPPGHVALGLERKHQLEKGFSLEHDRRHHTNQELITAAIYLLSAGRLVEWPWADSEKHVDNDYDQDRRLAVVGALVAAEYDRLAP